MVVKILGPKFFNGNEVVECWAKICAEFLSSSLGWYDFSFFV